MKVKHVWCDAGGGTVLGHIVRSSYVNADGETKSDISISDGSIVAMAYREPADRDSGGAGFTFWNIVDEEGSNC